MTREEEIALIDEFVSVNFHPTDAQGEPREAFAAAVMAGDIISSLQVFDAVVDFAMQQGLSEGWVDRSSMWIHATKTLETHVLSHLRIVSRVDDDTNVFVAAKQVKPLI